MFGKHRTPGDAIPDPDPLRSERRLLVVCIYSVVAIAVTAVVAKPAWRQATAWRARSLAGTAMKQAQQGDWTGAFAKASAAYELRPTEPEAIRAIASIVLCNDAAASFPLWKQLVESPGGTMEDRRSYVRSALARHLLGSAANQARFLLKAEPDSAPDLLLAAKVDESGGDHAGSLECARRAHQIDTGNDEVTLYLAFLLLKSPDSRSPGLDMLSKLIGSGGKWSRPAAVLAARQHGLSPAYQDRLIACLNGNPHASIGEKLLVLHLELTRHPEQRNALLQSAMVKYRGADGESLRQFGVWLNTHDEYGRTLAIIPREIAVTRNDLLLVHLDALASSKRWADIDALLSTKVPLDPAYVEAFLARSASARGDCEGFDIHWRHARRAATGNVEQLSFLATYAEKLGQPDKAEEIDRALAENSLSARSAFESLLRMARTNGTRATRNILGEMRRRWPSETAIQNDYAYFSLLLGEDLEASRQTAAQLVKSNPENLVHRTTLALACLRLGQPTAALEAYAGFSLDPEKLPAASAAVYAAVLFSNGRADEARKLAATLKARALAPEENALIQFGASNP